MVRPTILVVDDESCIRELIADILSMHFHVSFSSSGTEAIAKAQLEKPHLIILDVKMPGLCGIEACKVLRDDSRTSSIPILMVTALNNPDTRIEAFSSGADGYLEKPFRPDELVARVSSKLRRSAESKKNLASVIEKVEQISLGEFRLDFEFQRLSSLTEDIKLGYIEFKILNCLRKQMGKLVERDKLMNYVWGDLAPSERALDPHVNSLRKKFEASSIQLLTVYGQGYILKIEGATYDGSVR